MTTERQAFIAEMARRDRVERAANGGKSPLATFQAARKAGRFA